MVYTLAKTDSAHFRRYKLPRHSCSHGAGARLHLSELSAHCIFSQRVHPTSGYIFLEALHARPRPSNDRIRRNALARGARMARKTAITATETYRTRVSVLCLTSGSRTHVSRQWWPFLCSSIQ